MGTYEHRQFSPWALAAAAATALFGRLGRRSARMGLPLACAGIFVLQFSVLTTTVDDRRIAWAFGAGFPSGSIDLHDVLDAELTKTQWWEGYGIHWTPRHGWLWNAAGQRAVRIRKRNGSTITLGSDDAQGLYDAIRSRLTG